MKLNRQVNNVQRGGVKAESAFSIQTSAHAFEILSSGLYTDSVSAIIRELSCNAYDAHVMAGNRDTPFDIHVPSRVEPWFAIRDYGTGLSHEDVIGTYTTYFESTKSNSDDFIGALGLGSKSPFSYTNDFQVTSYFEGTEYKYAIFLNEAGVPSVALMGETPTSEPNGIEVRLPSEETYRFLSAIEKYLAYFAVKPNLLGVEDHEVENMYENTRYPNNSELDEPGQWFVSDSEGGYGDYTSRVGVVYGQVPYPLNSEKVEDGVQKFCTREEISFYSTFERQLVLIFDVGDLSITANREELKYDEETLRAIAGRLSAFHKKFFSQVKTAIESYEFNDSLYKTNRYLMKEVFQDHSKFYKSIDFSTIDCDAFKVLESRASSWSGSGFSLNIDAAFELVDAKLHEVLVLESYYSQIHDEDKVRASRGKGSSIDTLGISHNVHYYLIDDVRHGLAKAKQHFEENEKRNIRYVVIKPKHLKNIGGKLQQEELTNLIDALGNPDITLTSTLEYTAPVRKANNGSKKMIGTTFSHGPSWREATTSLEDGGIYIYLAGGTKMYKGSKAIAANDIFSFCNNSSNTIVGMVNIYNEVAGTQFLPSQLVGVSAADIKTFDADDKWVNVVDVVEDYINNNLEQMKEDRCKAATQESSFYNMGWRRRS